MIGNARVDVHAAAVVGQVADELERVRHLAGVAHASGVPHVPQRAEEVRVGVVLADQPASRFIGADLERDRALSRQAGLDGFAVGVGHLDGRDRRATGQVDEAGLRGDEDDSRRAGGEGVVGAGHRAALVVTPSGRRVQSTIAILPDTPLTAPQAPVGWNGPAVTAIAMSVGPTVRGSGGSSTEISAG